MSKKLAVIVSAGKGMGNHIAEKFAQENFKVVLIARRQAALEEYVAEFAAKGYEAYAKIADVADTVSHKARWKPRALALGGRRAKMLAFFLSYLYNKFDISFFIRFRQ